MEWKGKFEQASARAGEMKALVDVVMGDEQQLKTKATQQLTKIRLNLESEHADELRKIRQSYETEKNNLLRQLESVAVAVEEAKLSTVDTTAWQRLSSGAAGLGDGGDRDYGTMPQPTPIRTYVPTPPYNAAGAETRRTKHVDDSTTLDSADGNEKDRKKRKNKKHHRNRKDANSSSDTSTSSNDSSDNEDNDNNRKHKHGKTKRDRKSNNKNVDEAAEERKSGAGDAATTDMAKDLQAAQAEKEKLLQLLQQQQQGTLPRTSSKGRDLMDVRVTPSTNSNNNNSYGDSSNTSLSYLNQQQDLVEVQVENLERMLEIERRKHQETKYEVRFLKWERHT